MSMGKFITLEGIEGVGKSTNIKFVANLLEKKGKAIVTTREPGGTPLAEDIRHLILKEYDHKTLPTTELLLLYAGRYQHVEQLIKPALSAGKWVICDRFFDATFAYQGGGRGVDIDHIAQLNHWTLGDFAPDCTILLDAPYEASFERIKSYRNLDRFEKEKGEFFERIRQMYLQLAKQHVERFHVVDATQSLSAVQSNIEKIISGL